MDLHDNRKVLVAFIGSPGDVDEERRIARKAVDEANKTLKVVGWEIELRGWEDTLPGHGRPQGLINADVRACQLFIGLLYARWGTPTGNYSSGFEEEYRYALELKKARGTPEIWLFFKKVSEVHRGDPGTHLTKVLEFRKEVEGNREVLFKDLKNTHEWKKSLPDMLREYVLKLNEQTRAGPVASLPVRFVPAGGLVIAAAGEEERGVPRQLADALAAGTAQAGTLDKLGTFQSARLHLFATTALSNYTSIRLGIHETNLLYVHRTELEATKSERDLLYETVVASEGSVIPGWYWFSTDDAETTKRSLLRFALLSADENVRIRATQLLMETGIHPQLQGLTWENLVTRFLSERSVEARKVKVEYLAKVGIRTDLPALARLSGDEDTQVRTTAEQAHTLIVARDDPVRTLAEVRDEKQVLFKELADELARHADLFGIDTLKAMMSHCDPSARLFAARQLEVRGALTEEITDKLVKDPAVEVKAVGYRELLRVGVKLDLEDVEAEVRAAIKDSLLESMAREPFEALTCQLDLFSVNSWEAYETLAQHHFAQFKAKVRSDLNDEFEAMRSESIRRIRACFGQQAKEGLQAYKKNGTLDRFVRGKLLAIAMNALADNGGKEDVVFGRRYLDYSETDARRAAIKLLEKFGDESDCNKLLELAKGEWSTRKEAARAAIKLSRQSASVIQTLLDSEDLPLVEIGLGSLETTDFPAFRQTLVRLLDSGADGIRVLAVACLNRLADRAVLEEMLSQYVTKATYYYNVACWMDRVPYVPAALKEVFVRLLSQGQSNRYISSIDD